MKNYVIILYLSLTTSFFCNAQVTDTSLVNLKEDPENIRFLTKLTLTEINKFREDRRLDPLHQIPVLQKAAQFQAVYMTNQNKITDICNDKSVETTALRLQRYGGSGYGREIVTKIKAYDENNPMTYKEAARAISFQLIEGSRSAEFFIDYRYIFIGLGMQADKHGKFAYISCILGNYASLNKGTGRIDDLKIPYTTDNYNLESYDEKICRHCERFEDYHRLRDGLYVEKNKIYIKYDDFRTLSRLLRDPDDGLAVDIVQKAQYENHDYNIVDKSLVNKGILTKPVFIKKINKNNMVKGERPRSLHLYMGNLPKNIGEHEMNLIIIKNNHVCKSIKPVYTINRKVHFTKNLELLADTITLNNEKIYIPKAEDTVLTFKIPFKKGKHTFSAADIEEFIQSLNEPDFHISALTITAFSSLEGSEEANETVQKKRAESIVSELEKRQSYPVKKEIITKYNWEDFKKDIKATKYAVLAEKSLEQAKNTIREKQLDEELEPVLAKHRYALIRMDVTYEIEGAKEEKFVIYKFNNAVANNNRILALAIQKYIIKKVINGTYSNEAVFQMNIPESPENAGLIMNKIWLEKYINKDTLSEDYYQRINHLYELAPDNHYIGFNYLYARIMRAPPESSYDIENIQGKIDDLYPTFLSKSTIDALNIYFQFYILRKAGEGRITDDIVENSLEKIKSFADPRKINIKDAYQLAMLFVSNNDFGYACNLAEPFLYEENVTEDFLCMYISICTYLAYKTHTGHFVKALQKLREKNKSAYCDLFSAGKLSFQIFENKLVKQDFHKFCK